MSAAPDARRTVASPLGAAEAFNALATAEAGTTTPQAFLRDALAQLANLLGVSSCAILAREGGTMRCVAAVGLPSACAEAMARAAGMPAETP